MKELSKKLKDKWTKKLLNSGFIDIENADGTLKQEIHSLAKDPFEDGRQEYYYLAQDFLNVGKFATLLDYTIWKLHTEGMSYRTIGKELKLTFYRVQSTVKKIQKLAGVRK